VTFDIREGAHITADDWAFFHHCYTLTYRAHGSTPYLTLEAFTQLHAALPQHWLMFIASVTLNGQRQRVAASLLAIDRTSGSAWGRHWGSTRHIDCLHFEACYYQPCSGAWPRDFSVLKGVRKASTKWPGA